MTDSSQEDENFQKEFRLFLSALVVVWSNYWNLPTVTDL
jgi:hypothetical protein